MGECGCNLEFTRCKEHAGDVVLVLEKEDARHAMRWILGYRDEHYPADVEQGRALDRVTRTIGRALEGIGQ